MHAVCIDDSFVRLPSLCFLALCEIHCALSFHVNRGVRSLCASTDSHDRKVMHTVLDSASAWCYLSSLSTLTLAIPVKTMKHTATGS